MRRKLFIIPMLLVAIAAIAETSLVIQPLTGDAQANALAKRWGEDLVSQIDVFPGSTPNPFTFTYDARCKALVENAGAMSLVGWGLQINRIIYK